MARREQPDRHLLDRARLAGELALVRWLNAGPRRRRRRASSTRRTRPCATWPTGSRSTSRSTDWPSRHRDAAAGDRATCCPAGPRPAATTRRHWLGAWSRWTRMSLRCKRSTTSSPAPAARPARRPGAALSAGGAPWTGHFLPTLLGTPGPGPRAGGRRPTDVVGAGAAAYGIALLSRLPVLVLALAAAGPPRGAGCRCSCRRRAGRWCRCSMPDEPRAALAAVVETELGPLTVIGHAPVVPARRARCVSCGRCAAGPGRCPARGCCSATSTCPGRCRPGDRLAAAGRRADLPGPRTRGSSSTTRSADGLERGASGSQARTVRGEVSDHRAVVVDLSRRAVSR